MSTVDKSWDMADVCVFETEEKSRAGDRSVEGSHVLLPVYETKRNIGSFRHDRLEHDFLDC